MLKKIEAVLNLCRPANVVLTMVSVFIGAWICGTLNNPEFVLSGMLIGGFLCAGSNALNDFYDIEIDRINKPERPLPAGLIAPVWGLFWGVFLVFLSLYWSLLLGWEQFFFVLAAAAILWLYNYRGKRTAVLGNFLVALSAALAFIFGGMLNDSVSASLIPAAFAFLFHFSREVLKDVEDINGDSSRGVSSIPIRFGIEISKICISATFVLLIGFTFYPYIFLNYRWTYMVAALLGVDIFLVYIMFSLWQDAGPKNAGRLSGLLKWDMLAGIIALVLR